MKFHVQRNGTINQKLSLVYREQDYSFDVEPHNNDGFASILVNDLQLEIDDEGKIIYVWGLCPLIEFQETNETPKNFESSNLVAILEKPPIPGISYRLNEKVRWPISINKIEGLICIGNPKIYGEQRVEFIPGCVAVLDQQEITAIWLKPKKILK